MEDTKRRLRAVNDGEADIPAEMSDNLGADIGGGSLENLIDHDKVVHLKVLEHIILDGTEYSLNALLSDSNDRRSYQLVDRDEKNYKTLKIMQFFRPEKAIEAKEKLTERLIKTNTAIGTNYKLISLNPLDVAILSDYVEGVDLQKSIFSKQKAFSQDTTIDCLLQLLNYRVSPLHQGGIVHRDIKPSNIILNESNGNVKYDLIDVGSAREIGTGLTTGGIESGTLPYTKFSAVHEPTDDFYSLARTVYFLLTGKEPAFSPDKKLDKMADEQNYSSIPVNKKFRKILFKMAGHKDKYENCEELINDLLALKGIVSIEKAKGDAVQAENLEGSVSNLTIAYEMTKDSLGFLGSTCTFIKRQVAKALLCPSAIRWNYETPCFGASGFCPSVRNSCDQIGVFESCKGRSVAVILTGAIYYNTAALVTLRNVYHMNSPQFKYTAIGLGVSNLVSGLYEWFRYKKNKIIEKRKMLPIIR